MVADEDESGESKGHFVLKPTHVVEQRVSNLAQGLLTLGTMTGPLLVVLHLIPQGVLAGLFFIMGFQALQANGITAKLLFLCRDITLTSGGHPLKQIPRRRAVWLFVGIELIGFAATFAITQTVAAVGFPVFILALIPVRAMLLPRWFTPHELSILDEPTASPFTMENVGGAYGVTLDATEGGSGDETNSQGKTRGPEARGGLFGDTTVPSETDSTRRRSQEDLAELGENKTGIITEGDTVVSSGGGMTRRRGSAVGRAGSDGSDSIEMQRVGRNRRGQSSRAGH